MFLYLPSAYHHHQHHHQHQQHFASPNYEQLIYMFKSIPTKDSQFPQLPKCFKMEFGLQKSRVLVSLNPLLCIFLFHKNLQPLVTFCFLFSILNIHLSTISSYCLYFTFLVKTAWRGCIFFFWSRAGLSKILYDVGGILKKFAFEKNILCTPPPPPLPAVYIMNVALSLVMVFTPYLLYFRPYRVKR